MALNFFRKIGTIPFPLSASGGQRARLDLPRTAVWKRVWLHMYGLFDQTTGTGTLIDTQPESLLRDISIVANGSTILKSGDGHMFLISNRFDHLSFPPRQVIASSGADIQINTGWALDFAMPRSIRPIDTALDSSKWGTLQLVVTFGDQNDIITTPTGTFVFNMQIDVYVEEIVGLEGNFGLFIENQLQQSFAAVAGEQDLMLPTGDFYRGLTFRTRSSTLNTSDLIVQKISVLSGATRFSDDLGWGQAAPAAALVGGLNLQNSEIFGFVPPTGARRIDYAPDGLLTESLNSGALRGELKVRSNLGTSPVTGTLNVLTHQIINPQFVKA